MVHHMVHYMDEFSRNWSDLIIRVWFKVVIFTFLVERIRIWFMDARMGNFSTKIAKSVIILRIFLHHVELRISDQFCDFFSNENINLDLASIRKKRTFAMSVTKFFLNVWIFVIMYQLVYPIVIEIISLVLIPVKTTHPWFK